MRDPERIEPFMAQLTELWREVPDWRFGQLIMNLLSFYGRDPFYTEDEQMAQTIARFKESLHG